MNTLKTFLYLIIVGIAVGCSDDSAGGRTTPMADAAPSQDTGSLDGSVNVDGAPNPDATQPDAAINADAGTAEDSGPQPDPDALVDAMAPDMGEDPIVMPETACTDNEMCGAFERCVNELCTLDLRPDVFVISTVEVAEPANSAGLLQGSLQAIISANQLNLMVEPGGYREDGSYRWYVGNGGLRDGVYDYLGRYPVQNFDGFWRRDMNDSRYWTMERNTPFVLNVPAGQVQTADGVFTCMTAFNVNVEISITPTTDDAGNPELRMTLAGYLLESDARTVNFLFNGVEVSLTSLLQPADLNVDTDGDGVPDAYPFEFSGDAVAVTFVGDPPAADGSNRDPQAIVENPPECDE